MSPSAGSDCPTAGNLVSRRFLLEESDGDADLVLVWLPGFERQLSPVELDLIPRRGMFGITEAQEAEAKGRPSVLTMTPRKDPH